MIRVLQCSTIAFSGLCLHQCRVGLCLARYQPVPVCIPLTIGLEWRSSWVWAVEQRQRWKAGNEQLQGSVRACGFPVPSS